MGVVVAFLYSLSVFCRYVTGIMKMCMKNFNAEKKRFLTNLQDFEYSYFSTQAHIKSWLRVHTM